MKSIQATMGARQKEFGARLIVKPRTIFISAAIIALLGLVILILGMGESINSLLPALLVGLPAIALAVMLFIVGFRLNTIQANLRKELKDEVEPGLAWATRSEAELATRRAELMARLGLALADC